MGLTFLEDAVLTGIQKQTKIAVVREEGHNQAWIIAWLKNQIFIKLSIMA